MNYCRNTRQYSYYTSDTADSSRLFVSPALHCIASRYPLAHARKCPIHLLASRCGFRISTCSSNQVHYWVVRIFHLSGRTADRSFIARLVARCNVFKGSIMSSCTIVARSQAFFQVSPSRVFDELQSNRHRWVVHFITTWGFRNEEILIAWFCYKMVKHVYTDGFKFRDFPSCYLQTFNCLIPVVIHVRQNCISLTQTFQSFVLSSRQLIVHFVIHPMQLVFFYCSGQMISSSSLSKSFCMKLAFP